MDKNIKAIIEKAKKDDKIIAVALFGSSLKRKGKDVDICIFLDKKYSNLEMSKKRLSFLKDAKSNFDIQIFQQLPVYIRIRVIRECKILLDKNSDLLYEIVFGTIKEFGLFKKTFLNTPSL